MKKLLIFLLTAAILCLSACKTVEKTPMPTIEEKQQPIADKESKAKVEAISIKYGEKTNLEGTIIADNTSPSGYALKLRSKFTITIEDGDMTENFNTDIIFIYDDAELNGNYDFEKILNKQCTAYTSLENFRGAGQLFLLTPKIHIEGQEALKKKSVIKKVSDAPLLAEGAYILPDSFEINGKVSLDKVSYGYTEGNTPKDPFRLSIVLTPTDKNWYFIHRIYMDVLIFDENDEQIKSYHTEYAGHELSKNMQVIENLGFDNLYPGNQRYHIKENWTDFPSNAYSAAVLLSFDVFAKTEFGIYSNGNNVKVAPYELRYVEPQVFDAYVDINYGKLFQHR